MPACIQGTDGYLVQQVSYISKLKSSRTCLIGYSGFISINWFFIAGGEGGGGHTHTHTYTYRCLHQSNFKKPGIVDWELTTSVGRLFHCGIVRIWKERLFIRILAA